MQEGSKSNNIDGSLFIFSSVIIKIMNEARQLPQLKHTQEMRAVNRLLEVAEKRTILEQSWQESQKKEYIKSSSQSLPPSSKKAEKKEKTIREQAAPHQKTIQKQRLLNLIRQTINKQQESALAADSKPDHEAQKNPEQMAMTMRFLKNAKLRPFNSNMTFYTLKKDQKQRLINSSLTFYKNDHKQKERDIHTSLRLVKNNELEPQERTRQKSDRYSMNQIIYFRPNKSETVRELLNQMKEERSKHREIVMNAAERKNSFIEEAQPEIAIFNEHQVRMMNRYKRFVPFQKDEGLLFRKLFEGDNIWLKKYKQSWIKRKNNQDGKKQYFKRLIVNN